MAQLRQDYNEFVARNTEVLVISPEDAPLVAAFWRSEKMPMSGFADPGHEVAAAYGQRVSLLHMGRLPTAVLLDRNGAVRDEHRGSNMMDLPNHKRLLGLIDELNREWEQSASMETVQP